MPMNKQRGMTLLEVAVVMLIFAILAAMSAPAINRMRMSANETSAISSLRTFYNASTGYALACPANGFPLNPTELTTGAQCPAGIGFVDAVLAAGLKSGYTFTYTPGTAVNGITPTFNVVALPVTVNVTGIRGFRIDDTGVVRYTNTGLTPTAGSPSLQ